MMDICCMALHYKNNYVLKTGIHTLIWAVLFLFPYIIIPDYDDSLLKLFTYTWLPLIQYFILFYLNYFIFITRFLFQKRYMQYAGINLALILLFLWLYGELHNVLHEFMHEHPFPLPKGDKSMHGDMPPPPPIQFFILKDFFSLFIPVIFSVAIKAMENWIETEAEKKELKNRNLESELLHLRYQLQPHFFFNSLNNIYSLVEVSPLKAQIAIHNLSKLMRYLLYDTGREKVVLSEEISFLKKYIQLMELRQTTKTTTHFIFPEEQDLNYYVAPLLFIPMIENAYKHGVSATQPSHISFAMTVKANQLFFSSENTNFPKNNTDKSGSGIGLDNLKKRLELLYHDKYELNSGIRDQVYWITLRITLDKPYQHKTDV
jgi:hypothetical protein